MPRKPDTSIPAPWRVDPDSRPNMEYNNHIVAANGNGVCFMAWSGDNEDNEPHEKAAHLISAAPDLRAAVEALWRATDGITGLKDGAAWDQLQAAKKIAEAAIRKADR